MLSGKDPIQKSFQFVKKERSAEFSALKMQQNPESFGKCGSVGLGSIPSGQLNLKVFPIWFEFRTLKIQW